MTWYQGVRGVRAQSGRKDTLEATPVTREGEGSVSGRSGDPDVQHWCEARHNADLSAVESTPVVMSLDSCTLAFTPRRQPATRHAETGQHLSM